MEIDALTANEMSQVVADRLAGGHVDVFDSSDRRLVRCRFADPAFDAVVDGTIVANPFPPGIAERDGVPVRFKAQSANGERSISGTAGYRGDIPAPQMQFKTRRVVEGADVMIESFVFSVITNQNM